MDSAEVAVMLNGTQVRTEIYLLAIFAVTAVWHLISAEYIYIMIASRFGPELLSVFADSWFSYSREALMNKWFVLLLKSR